MSGPWKNPDYEISENGDRQFVVSRNGKWLATFLMFADARDFALRRIQTDSLDEAAKALEGKPVFTGVDWGES